MQNILVATDLKHNWHPFTQMALAEPPIVIVKGEKEFLYTADNQTYIDGISSWWTNLHGHSNPHIAQSLFEQASTLEHVLFAGFTHPQAIRLAERLAEIVPIQSPKFFYSDNGSTAVEVALKMSLQFWHNQGISKPEFIAIEGSYHGDTFGSMSVSSRSTFSEPFETNLFTCHYIPIPTAENIDACITQIQSLAQSGKIAACIFEPLNLGTAGMLQYPSNMLKQVIETCKANQILTIADEVMTGFGRTGKHFACDYLSVQADIMCLSKGLTGGTMPMGLTVASEQVYSKFHSENKMHTFFHGHSYTANPLGCAVANASLDLLLQQSTKDAIEHICMRHTSKAIEFRQYSSVKAVRHLGTILAVEFINSENTGYFNTLRDYLYQQAMEMHVVLRPLGNVLYTIPPYCIQDASLDRIYACFEHIAKRLAEK